jgi:TonB-dependent SusC/RagA subfamily outer membrane receptor
MKNIVKIHGFFPVFLMLFTTFPLVNVIAQEAQSEKTDSVKHKIIVADQILTGYKTQTPDQITGSVSILQNDKFLTVPSANILRQLQGIVPGLTVIGSGQPGGMVKCYIRGIGSYSGTTPLFIVDGLPFDNIQLLNPGDIESIAVLKDASAAIYGGRALNGVIVISTKKAARGFHVRYNNSIGWQLPGKGTAGDLLNTQEYANLQWLVYKNDQRTEFNPIYGPSTNPSPTIPSWAANTDWYDALTSVELIQNHDLSVSAGSENSKIYLGASYFDQNGIILNTGIKRYTIRFNSEFTFLKKHLKIGENFQIANQSGRLVPENGANNPILGGPYGSQSIIPVYITEPVLGISHNFLPGEYGGTGIAPRLGNSTNVVADQTRNKDNYTNDQQLAGNAYADLTIINGLDWRTAVGGTWRTIDIKDYNYATYENSENSLTSSLSKANTELKSWIVTSFLSLDKTFGNHHLYALAGVEKIKSFIGDYKITTTEGIDGTGRILSQSGYNYVPNVLQSLFANAGYAYKDKYLLDISGRSESGKFFPAVSVGWCLSNETFLNSIGWLNLLKIRGSYGRTGNMYAKWEYVNTSDIGFDSRFLNNHIGFAFDWFSRDTRGLYVTVSVPGTSGGNPGYTTNASMKNSGYEATLNFNKSAGAIRFNADIIFSVYKNKIGDGSYTFFDEGYTRIGQIVRNQQGHPISSFFGYKVIGLFSDAADVTNSPVQDGAQPGFFKYADLNGDRVVDYKDRTFLGDPNPDFTAGLNLNLSYNGFDIGALFYLSQGNDIYNFTKWWTDFWPSFSGQKSKGLLYNSWTESNKSATIPKASNISNFSTNTQNSSYFVEDGSFIRCRSLQLGYSFNEGFLHKFRISSLRLYVQAVNLFTLTKYSGLDPELGDFGEVAFGIDNGNYPNVRQVSFGVQLGI